MAALAVVGFIKAITACSTENSTPTSLIIIIERSNVAFLKVEIQLAGIVIVCVCMVAVSAFFLIGKSDGRVQDSTSDQSRGV